MTLRRVDKDYESNPRMNLYHPHDLIKLRVLIVFSTVSQYPAISWMAGFTPYSPARYLVADSSRSARCCAAVLPAAGRRVEPSNVEPSNRTVMGSRDKRLQN